jgi:hypothetical protein
MDWLQVAVQWLHVLLGIVWFGSAITTNLVFVPALMRLPIARQAEIGVAYGEAAGRVDRVAGIGVIALGLLRGTVFGPIQGVAMLSSPYGLTWLVALIAAVATSLWGNRVLAPAVGRIGRLEPARAVLADGSASPELRMAIAGATRKSVVQLLGFVVVFSCMILMRFGM